MTVLQVQPENPLKAGIMLKAFTNTPSGEIVAVPAILMTQTGQDIPVAPEALHRLAKAFEDSMNGNAPLVERVVKSGHAFHYHVSENGRVLNLHHRRPSDVLTQGGSNSLPGIEFRILQIDPAIEDDLVSKLNTPSVIQTMLDNLVTVDAEPGVSQKASTPKPQL